MSRVEFKKWQCCMSIKDTLWVSAPNTLDLCVFPNIFAIYDCKFKLVYLVSAMRYPVSKILMKNLNFVFLGLISMLSDRIILDNCYQWITTDLSFSMIYHDPRYV